MVSRDDYKQKNINFPRTESKHYYYVVNITMW